MLKVKNKDTRRTSMTFSHVFNGYEKRLVALTDNN